jgi:hypothetical protein
VALGIAATIARTERELVKRDSDEAQATGRRLSAAREAYVEVVEAVLRRAGGDPNAVYAGSVPYLMLAGATVAGWQMARALLAAEDAIAEGTDAEFMRAKIATARFYADHVLSRVSSWRHTALEGASATLAMPVHAY